MKKHISHPPLVILLDILFIFLFILILKESKTVEIDIPKEKLLKDADVIYKKGQEYYSAIDKNKRYFFSKEEYYHEECYEQIFECKQAIEKGFSNAKILLPSSLFEEIGKITFIIFKVTSCKKIVFYITLEGKINYQKMINEFNCLLEAPEIKNKLLKFGS